MRRARCLVIVLALGCGDDDGTSSSGTTETSTSAGSTTQSATTGGADSTGTGADACVDEDEATCVGVCRARVGRPILDSPDGFCVGPEEFLGCGEAFGCGSAITYACPPDSTDTYVFTTLCIPEGWTACEPPAMLPPQCP